MIAENIKSKHSKNERGFCLRSSKMKKNVLFIAIVLFLFVIPINGHSEWSEFLQQKDGIILYVDKNSVKYGDNGNFRIWVKEFLTDTEVEKYGKEYPGLKKDSHVVILFEIDCRNDMFRVLSTIFYNIDGNSVGSSNVSGDWLHIVPGSVSQLLQKFYCLSR